MSHDHSARKQRSSLIPPIVGMCTGAVLAAVSLYGQFQEPTQKPSALMIVLRILAWLSLAWGSVQLAKYRGYDGAAGCGLFLLGFVVLAILVRQSLRPAVHAVGFAFAIVWPVTILFALPNRAKRSRH